MKHSKLCSLVFLANFLYIYTLGQTIDKEVIDNYNPSVVSRLFSIAKYVKIDKEQQLRMAYSIHAHDSTLTSWISIGKSTASIDTLQQVAQFQLYGMLSPAQLQTYKYNSTFEISNAIAKGEAEYINQEYKPDSLTYIDIKKSLTNKYNYILQNFSENYLMNQENAIGYLKQLSAIYDGYNYFPLLYSKKYIVGYIAKINELKRETPKEILHKIEHTFYNFLWQNKYTDWSLAAKNALRLHMPDTALFSILYKKELEQQVSEQFATERYELIFKDHVSETAFHKLESLVKEKCFKKILMQETYAAYYPQRYDWELKQTSEKYDSTIKATLIYDGSLQPTTQFAIALKFKEELGIQPKVCSSLVKHAMYLEKQRDSILFADPFASIDFGEYEATHLSPLLNETQYNTVLFHKTRTYAAANALTDWEEMVVRGLNIGFNKGETIDQMTQYYIIKNSAWNRYANDKIKLWANLRSIDEMKPKALKILDPVRWSGTTQKSTNNLQLQW